MTAQATPVPGLAPGQSQYLSFCEHCLKMEQAIMPKWDELPEGVRFMWAKVANNMNDQTLIDSDRAAWDYYCACALDPMMPDWDSMPPMERFKWSLAMRVHAIHGEPTLPSNADKDPREELRKMRSYSKCFTNAYDKRKMVFVLTDTDTTAWKVIAQWCVLNIPLLGEAHEKIISAKALLARFKEKADAGKTKNAD